jgi:hypothetical protein
MATVRTREGDRANPGSHSSLFESGDTRIGDRENH